MHQYAESHGATSKLFYKETLLRMIDVLNEELRGLVPLFASTQPHTKFNLSPHAAEQG